MKRWQYEPAADLDQTLIERLRNFPREPDMLVYGLRSFVALIIRALLRTYCRFEIVGEEHLRSNRSFVLVANHSSHLDTVCLLAGLPLRRLHRAFPAAAADYFFKSVPRTWVATVVVNALPFARHELLQFLDLTLERGALGNDTVALPTVVQGGRPSALPVIRTRTAPRSPSRARAI